MTTNQNIAPHLDDSHDDGLVHSHGWASEPAMPTTLRGLKTVPQAHIVPTPSTAFRDDQMDH
ncbi:hypothetical protein NON00_17755 [Roseomonas sp. GC11]|uniref:hypothetical protein n=1 Tax=Roseomonas sp. GC11 TaxID=2950546 RepID=UPI002109A4AE|nr:hypothetical protein [Roseomonas sp. GC11]MCQ4161762.1 hypothetical protein [Roseomonas sp. GC11]